MSGALARRPPRAAAPTRQGARAPCPGRAYVPAPPWRSDAFKYSLPDFSSTCAATANLPCVASPNSACELWAKHADTCHKNPSIRTCKDGYLFSGNGDHWLAIPTVPVKGARHAPCPAPLRTPRQPGPRAARAATARSHTRCTHGAEPMGSTPACAARNAPPPPRH